ncbi:F-box only protein 16 [Nerophis ophidion]|uniref:F-box only protein 16 n=1 Tax=Nerophis ophidion TaxID=159077 RepID=UPI002ADFA8D9|nr:F-box only protein 16 [Nerophis ophidion]
MPRASDIPASSAKMQSKLSAWTPLNHPLTNSRLFEERRWLLKKWVSRTLSFAPQLSPSSSSSTSSCTRQFRGWSESQRRVVLSDILSKCSKEQLEFVGSCVSRQLPLQAADFTCVLPRTVCLYVFSFLDPRSLCRCAQVSWRWRSLAEMDQVWMPKCVRLGWFLTFWPSQFEGGAWKRQYVQKVKDILLAPNNQHTEVAASSKREVSDVPLPGKQEVSDVPQRSDEQDARRRFGGRSKKEKVPPWRDADRCPKDTRRFNYLDNLDTINPAIGPITAASTKGRDNIFETKTQQSNDMRRKMLSDTNYKLRKVKSLMLLTSNCEQDSPPQPRWASPSPSVPVTMETAEKLLRLSQWNAGKRPGPARTPIPSMSVEALKASQRSNRSLPSAPLFEFQPWTWSGTLQQHAK